jgi:DNA-directed RNA polymerase subunit M/transcription elongation factor TFIIS
MDNVIRSEWGLFFIVACGGLFAGNAVPLNEGSNVVRKYKAMLERLEKNTLGKISPSATHKGLSVISEKGQTGAGRDYEISISWIRDQYERIIPVFLAAREEIIKGRSVDFFANFNIKGKRLPQVKCPECGDPGVVLEIIHEKSEFAPAETFLSASCKGCSKTVSELDFRRDILKRYGVKPTR